MAEYAIAPITTTIKRRSDVTPAVGVAMGISGFAALQSVRNSGGIAIDHEGSKKSTKNVLIRAATGGVGLLAVQVGILQLPNQLPILEPTLIPNHRCLFYFS